MSSNTVVRSMRAAALAAVGAFAFSFAQAQTALADQPLFSNSAVPGNLALVLSVEYPTAVSVAHIATTYSTSSTYLGYFDPNKCYTYVYSATEANRYFAPAGTATTRTCTGGNDTKWSGNFLNWATTQTIDPFRWALTGGYRVRDTATETWIEKAWASGQGGTGNFPNRSLGNAALVAGATPFSTSSMAMRIQGLGNKMRFSITGNVDNAATAYDPAAAFSTTTVYEVSIRVKVCDSSAAAGGVEANCRQYPNGNYKPEGLLQQYANRIRFSAFGYLNDSNVLRDGGVLRAQQKFVGPTRVVPGQPDVANSAREWDPDTGVFVLNPDAADAADTATLFGVSVTNSGVLNYLNKFGQVTPGSYKTYDPIGELYYAAIRYFKRLGDVPEYSSMTGASTATKTTWVDGFPVITNWNAKPDPIQYSCQRNFILGIGDVNTHADKNLPGPTPTGSEPAKPSAVTADTSVNSVDLTNRIGTLEGLGSTLGLTNPYNGCCTNNSALMAGLAYDANTRDIRPDIANQAGSVGQTIQTYWLDVLEFSTYKASNQFYLAAKYGGFRAPSTFDPTTNTTPLTQSWWNTTTETVGGQPRPDNYYTASQPDQMVAGLTRAFASIAAQLTAYTTSFSTSVPQVSSSGNASFSTQYDTRSWTGEVIANALSINAAGNPSQEERWRFSTQLATQAGGTGWDTNRNIVTWNPSSQQGVPFRIAQLNSTQVSALDTPYRSGNDSTDYLNYLRGQRLHEQASTDPTSTRAYRTRSSLVGDIVDAKAIPVGPPSMPFSDAANPGYAAFKLARANRAKVAYVASNDGMVHAIHGDLTGPNAGRELFAYVPNAAFAGGAASRGLATLGNPDFVHYYLVNASPDYFDIDFNRTNNAPGTAPDWRTILIGGLGKGGRSYYALDITNPTAVSGEASAASRVLWEFTDPDMGYTYGQPIVMKTRRWGWVAVLASGHNNADGRGYFFIVNPRNGALLQKISTGVGTAAAPAGLANVNAYVLDNTDGTADAVYAGDLLGNLWRLDVTATASNYPAPVRLAQLTDGSGNAQPVTTRPLIEVEPGRNRRFVLVGTGRLLDNSDTLSDRGQSFYAILDGTASRFNDASQLPSGVTFPIRRTDLLNNSNPVNGVVFNQPSQMGWYLDFGVGAQNIAWRMIIDADTFLGSVAFATLLPSGDACNPSGNSRLYAVAFGSGQTDLVNSAMSPQAYLAVEGKITDVRYFSVEGRGRLIFGTDRGQTAQASTRQLGTLTPRRLNWRELPIVD